MNETKIILEVMLSKLSKSLNLEEQEKFKEDLEEIAYYYFNIMNVNISIEPSKEFSFRPDFIYLHGKLEEDFEHDIFYTDTELIIKEGIHDIIINNKSCKLYSHKHKGRLVGLIVYSDDNEANEQALISHKKKEGV